jgi:nicotinic acid mononucleotide adenylyltransferase
MQIDDIEIKCGKMIPTYHLMNQMKAMDKYKGCRLYFVMGSDLLTHLHLWDEAVKLKAEIDFIIFVRTGWKDKLQSEDALPAKYSIVEGAYQTDMSSTKIRQRIEKHWDGKCSCPMMGVFGLVTHNVREYIKVNNLYKERPN